ncbi:hypothetical protein [Clostridium sp.]|uniref:hypothetical protein n=1 Tax=Clostridium sp. TaxID=1506 RepID=UPI002FC7EA6F
MWNDYSKGENGIETNHQELIDNSEYHSEDSLIKDIAKRLGVNKDIIEIIYQRDNGYQSQDMSCF